MRALYLLFSLILLGSSTYAQVVLPKDPPGEIALAGAFRIADVGKQTLDPVQVYRDTASLSYLRPDGKQVKLGFTDHIFWGRFSLKNASGEKQRYYLEAGVTMTDLITCYTFDQNGRFSVQKSGDAIPFSDRSVANRRPLFQITLAPDQEQTILVELRNDGERNNFPVQLISEKTLLEESYFDQGVLGLFYGILLIIAITYLFFYFALNERSFLFYSLYVIFAGLCQFALDGLYNQYIDGSASWTARHAVIISAALAAFFFGRYTEVILNIEALSHRVLFYCYRSIYLLLGITMVCIVFVPGFLPLSYPLVNILTFMGMLLIFSTVAALLIRGHRIDPFFIAGIAFLFLTITSVIAANFHLIGNVSLDDVTKMGMGLEFVALSLSMANRIYFLKTEKEKLAAIDLQRCKEINDIKSFFLSNMSHELRTPLNAILGVSAIMEEEAANATIREQSAMISTASRSLIASVNDILDYSLIERNSLKLDKSPFSPHKILQKLSDAAAQKAAKNGLSYHFISALDPEMCVSGDAARLEQITWNILTNAVKFTPAGSVHFYAETQVSGDRMVLNMRVDDTGIGISREKLAAGFGLFSQDVMDNKRRFGGFGIGLSVVNALIDLHGGQFSVESTPGSGTQCRISLSYPLVRNTGFLEVKKAPVVRVASECHTVLVVEDNPVNQAVMKMILKKWDNTIAHFAADGEQGLAVLKKTDDVDLILLDLQMPVMDGYEMLSALRKGAAGSRYADLPVLVITADVTDETRERVFGLGADDLMTKPVDKELLRQKATALLGRYTEALLPARTA